ncbi:MAG: SPOR domain-containing protein [Cytophagales bacterium]|nr:SPOR domain-containing protein [Cytophagales bacterium]MDW8385331.1 SPOR domain-containing protein [Flammeovirgaceae bacterium]
MIRSVILVLIGGMSLLVAQAQTKRKIIEENEQLKQEKVELQKANVQLEREKQALQKENAALKQENQMLSSEVRRLQDNLSELKEANRALTIRLSENTSAAKSKSTPNETPSIDPNDKRPCAIQQNKLAPNQSYFLTLNKLNTKGWGIQVYSYSTLCMALEKAQEFSKQYKMYNTYIRVKEVDGKRVFSVVYGSLKDEASARSYCENFRKIAKDREGQNAFVIQH